MPDPHPQASALAPLSLGERLQAVAVSVYLVAVLGWLLLRGRIRGTGLGAWLRSFLRPRVSLQLAGFQPEDGHCYIAPCPPRLANDRDSASPFVLLEDGRPLPYPHAGHDDIRRLGAGRYSHWGESLYFAASDNTDPRSNGRSYRLVETRW